MPESGSDDEASDDEAPTDEPSTDDTSDDEAATAEAPANPIAANTRNVVHPVAWIDAAGDAVDAAEMEPALDYPYLDVAGGTLVEVAGRQVGLSQGRAARIAVPLIEDLAGRFLSSDQS
ncbi:hypothetical protein ACFQH6_04690 [Halobacteriaceae archaeon GCM10025711]